MGRCEPLRTPLAVIRRVVSADENDDGLEDLISAQEEEEECARLATGAGVATLGSETARKTKRRRSSIGAFNNNNTDNASTNECQYRIVAILKEKLVFRQRPEHIVAAEHRGRKG